MKTGRNNFKLKLSTVILSVIFCAIIVILLPGMLWIKSVVETRLVNARLNVLKQINSSWTIRINEKFVAAEHSISRFADLLSKTSFEPSQEHLYQFDKIIRKDVDGAWRSDRKFFSGNHDAGLWLQKNHVVTAETKAFFIQSKRLTEIFGKGALVNFGDTWVLPREGGIIIFWPSQPEWIYGAAADLDYTETEWVSLTNPVNNPEGVPRWTPTSFDPAPKVWMLSVVAPYKRNGNWAGAVGHDLPISDIMKEIEEVIIYPSTNYMLVMRDGRLLLSNEFQNRILESNGKFTIADTADQASIQQFRIHAEQSGFMGTTQFFRDKEKRIIITNHIKTPNWYFISIVPEIELLEAVKDTYGAMLSVIGFILIVLTLLPSLLIYRMVIPALGRILAGTRQVTQGNLSHSFQSESTEEFDGIAESFNKMIEARKVVEESLTESERRYRLLADNVTDNIWTLQISNMRMIYSSPSVERLLGYTPAEIQDMELSDYIAPESLKRISTTISEELEKENLSGVEPDRSITLEIEQIKKNGSRIWTEITARFLRDSNGIPDRILGIARDITERKKSEKDLAEERNKLEIVTKNVGVGLAVISKDYRTVWANRVLIDIFGDVENKHCYSTYNLQKDVCSGCGVREVFTKSKELVTHEQKGKDANGNIIWSQIIATPIKDEDGNITSALEVVVPITERKQMEEQLRHAQKMESVGTLTGGIAPDFNNILGIILGNTEIALDDVPEWNPAYHNLEQIKNAGLRASGIIKQLLSFSRKTEQELKPVEISSIIEDALKLLRPTIPATIEIRKKIPVKDKITILADPVQINQVMMNLCINAAHAMEETGGILEISVEKVLFRNEIVSGHPDLNKGDYIKLTVRDTGPGIAPELIDNIFDPYFTTKEVGKGSGIGLAVVHGIVKNHKGAITVDSQLGNGASFNILLPVHMGELEIEENNFEKIPHGNETILFVDDEEPIVDMATKMLERLGYTVENRTTPWAAIELFQSKPDHFDLVITDMTMPQMTGAQLSKKLVDIRADIPVIICTGYSPLIDEEKVKNLEVAAYIMKPISRQEMANTIRKVLDRDS
jgi:PAS domain S-box-containing protein